MKIIKKKTKKWSSWIFFEKLSMFDVRESCDESISYLNIMESTTFYEKQWFYTCLYLNFGEIMLDTFPRNACTRNYVNLFSEDHQYRRTNE